MNDDDLREGDLITIKGDDGKWRNLNGQKWRVGKRDDHGDIRLHPCHEDGTLDAFNDAAGEYWIRNVTKERTPDA